VAGCIFWVTRHLRIPRVPATILTIIASFAYALFTGFATPVERSLWMVTLYLLGRLVYREHNALNTIGFAALCLLVVSPRTLFDSSLQMTLLAVIAIAGVAVALFSFPIRLRVKAKAGLFRHRPFLAGGDEGLAHARSLNHDSLSQHNLLTPFQDLSSLKDGKFCRCQTLQKRARFLQFGTLP